MRKIILVRANGRTGGDDGADFNLLRLPEKDDETNGFMWLAAGIIEFSASKIPQPHLLELAQMQKEILAWKHLWPLDPARSLLALQTRNRSDRLLQMAGLLG